MAAEKDGSGSSIIGSLSSAEKELLYRRLFDEFPEFLKEKAAEKSPYYQRFLREGIDELLESLYTNPYIYYELRAFLRPHEIIEPPEAYRKHDDYQYIRDVVLPQCQEELKGGLPTGVFNFDEMKSYGYDQNPDYAYCQDPCGLFLISRPGLFYPDSKEFMALDPPLETNFRLVIDDAKGIDLFIRPELQEEINPTFAGLYLVDHGVVQLTLQTVVWDENEVVRKELESPEGPSRALQAAMRRGSYFMHATLYKQGDEWLIAPGMTQEALVMNERFIREYNLFDRIEPSARHVPFVKELFGGILM